MLPLVLCTLIVFNPHICILIVVMVICDKVPLNYTQNSTKKEKKLIRGAWQAQLLEHVAPNLGVVSSSPTLGVELTYEKKTKNNTKMSVCKNWQNWHKNCSLVSCIYQLISWF